MVNISQNTVTPTATIYPYVGLEMARVVDDNIIYYTAGHTEATIYAITGTSTTEIEFDRALPDISMYAAPYKEMYDIPVYAGKESIYCYDNSVGVCSYNLDGSVTTLIPQESIQVKDYQRLDNLNLWGIAVGDADHIALYDNTLKSIRMIQPTP